MREPISSTERGRRVLAAMSFIGLTIVAAGCGTQAPVKPATPSPYEDTPVPTVPPRTPTTPAPATPPPTPAALKTRPIGADVKAKPGEAIGPIISFFGAARADGMPVEPTSVDKNGVPTYTSVAGSGFILVVEAKPGVSNKEVGRRLYAYVEDDPHVRGDLEIVSNRDLGDGSRAVCDRQRPKIGGVPAVAPASFEYTQPISDAINDLACRFENFVESDFSCTMDKSESYSFVDPATTTQFCLIVARAYGFPEGTTELSVRVRDIAGDPGPVKKMRIFRPKEAPKPKEQPKKKAPQK